MSLKKIITNKFNLDSNIKIAKIIIWLFPLVILFIILNGIFIPSGSLKIKYDVTSDSRVVTNFAAKEPNKLIGVSNQINDTKEQFQLITTTPLYFNVKVPRAFAKATIFMKYQNPDNQPKIQLAVQQANEAYYYNDMALYNDKLENLDDHWNSITEGNITLWQKDKNYYNAKYKKISVLDEKYKQEMEELDKRFPAEIRSLLDEKEYKKIAQRINENYNSASQQIIYENRHLKSDEVEYKMVNDFLNNFPDPSKVLQYNYNLSYLLQIPGYKPSNTITEINKSIRGSHEILTYLGEGEDLNFIFTIQDSNRHEGDDTMTVKVFNSKNELIKEVAAPDDGIAEANGMILSERRHQLLINNMPFGTYRIMIDIPYDDIFIKKIQTSQHLLVFNKKIYLTDNIEYKDIINSQNISSTTLFTNSTNVGARTSHNNGLQILKVGKYDLKIDDLHILNSIENVDGIIPIISPKNDIYLEGDGYFSFSKDQMFDPYFSLVKNVDQVENINEYDYILTNYPRPKEDGDWLLAEASIANPYLYLNKKENNQYNFIIDFIGLPENNRQIKIKELDIIFEKEPISLSNILTKFKNWYNKNFN